MRLSWSLALLGVVLLAGALLVPAAPAGAQSARRCFGETGYCISGRMREFWEQNGGLPVFGLPITPLQRESIEGRSLQVQWFERTRLELHPQLRRPYDVQIGRLGAELLAQRPDPGPAAPVDGECRMFRETGRSVCGAILARWRASGLELDGRRGTNDTESLALFGLPLTDAREEVLSDGVVRVVQWFERGRLEIHAGGVLLGLLGSERGPVAQAAAPVALVTPARLVVTSINLDFPIVAVGLDGSGAPIVPDHDVGWYNLSARPGQGENTVLWGHVLRFRHALNRPAPFARLKELPIGAQITLYGDNGAAYHYRVVRQLRVRPDAVEYILPQGRELLTMVSCIGDQVVQGNEVVDMSHRLITIAEPIA